MQVGSSLHEDLNLHSCVASGCRLPGDLGSSYRMDSWCRLPALSPRGNVSWKVK